MTDLEGKSNPEQLAATQVHNMQVHQYTSVTNGELTKATDLGEKERGRGIGPEGYNSNAEVSGSGNKSGFTLRNHQLETIERLRQSLRAGNKKPIIQLPTGAGKTVIACKLIEGIISRNQRVAFTVPAIGLINQTIERLAQHGISRQEIGVVQASHPLTNAFAPIQICSVDTLRRRHSPDVQWVIVDEAHRYSKAIADWMEAEPDLKFIGLTATPWAKHLGTMFDDLIQPVSIQQLIDNGILADFKVFAPDPAILAMIRAELEEIKVTGGDYQQDQLGNAMGKKHLVADVVETWMKRGKGLPTLCFAVDRKHARALCEQFQGYGVKAAYIDANSTEASIPLAAETETDRRDEIGRMLGRGDLEVVVNVGTCTTGIDWDVRCLILARPTRSEMLFVQIIGRALRTAPGKEYALILDHSDTHQRLGMVTSIGYDTLDDAAANQATKKRKEREERLPRECPSCAYLMPPAARLCPNCGVQRQLELPEEFEGELVELSTGERIDFITSIERCRGMSKPEFWGHALGIARIRGYKEGWAKHLYKKVFGVWPRGVGDVSPERNPHPAVFKLANAQNKANAKKRAPNLHRSLSNMTGLSGWDDKKKPGAVTGRVGTGRKPYWIGKNR